MVKFPGGTALDMFTGVNTLRRPWGMAVALGVTAFLLILGAVTLMAWFQIAVWGINQDGTLILSPWVMPLMVLTGYTFAISLHVKVMPTFLQSLFGIILSFVCLLESVLFYMFDWPGMTRGPFYLSTDIIDLAESQSRAPYIIAFILGFGMLLLTAVCMLMYTINAGAWVYWKVQGKMPWSKAAKAFKFAIGQ